MPPRTSPRRCSYRVDSVNKTVTSRFLWASSTAAWREGYGVTLLRGATADELRAQKYPLQIQTPASERPLPEGDSAVSARMAYVGDAFMKGRAYGGHPFAFVVMHRGGAVCERYDEGITPETRLLSWSMAKSFTNAVTASWTSTPRRASNNGRRTDAGTSPSTT